MDIHHMPTVALFVIVTLVSTWAVSFSYKNVKFFLKHR